MVNLKTDPIGLTDLQDYLEDYSDFSFEIKVLKLLVDAGFVCEHGGSYEDPVTKKTREFDIRAVKCFDKRFLRFAVECKNLRENFPLLVSCVPRTSDEAFHEICFSVNPDICPLEEISQFASRAMRRRSKNIRSAGDNTIYMKHKPVGKSCAQVGRKMHNDEIEATDSQVYEKWSQALSSADDLIYLACTDGEDRTGDLAISLVFPLLVIPNERLWVTLYDFDGNRIKEPHKVNHCSYFVNRSYYHGNLSGDELTISHLEFVTIDGLIEFIEDLTGDEDKLDKSFPREYILSEIWPE
jgi:hypothetical protein